MSVRVESDSRVTPVPPGGVHGNSAAEVARTIVVIHRDRWTLSFDGGEGTAIESRSFSGAGAVRIGIDAHSAYAIRNDGGVQLEVIDDPAPARARVLAAPMVRLAGLDGCRRGWMAIIKDEAAIEARVCTTDEELLALFASCAVVAIDVPIGLSEHGPRSCDHHARRFLGRRASCVFPAPLRPMLAMSDYQEANRVSNHLQQRGISKQGWAIVPKVAQIDHLLQRQRQLRGRVYEVHPEVSFACWSGGPLDSKRSEAGLAARRTLVARHFGAIPEAPRGASEDDVLDAFAALWTAERIHAGRSQSLGDAHDDLTGLPMRIVY